MICLFKLFIGRFYPLYHWHSIKQHVIVSFALQYFTCSSRDWLSQAFFRCRDKNTRLLQMWLWFGPRCRLSLLLVLFPASRSFFFVRTPVFLSSFIIVYRRKYSFTIGLKSFTDLKSVRSLKKKKMNITAAIPSVTSILWPTVISKSWYNARPFL